MQQLIRACGVRLGRERHARDLLLRIDRQNGRVCERLKLRLTQRPAADGGGERPSHLRVLQLFICVVDADIVQRRARCLQRVDRTADDRRCVVGCDARAAHDRHVARPEAGLRRVRPGDADQLDMADGAEKAAVPVFILFERVRAAVLDRHIWAGAVGEAAAVRAPPAVNRDVQQARKVRIGRGEHDAHLIGACRFQRRHVGKAAVIGRGGVVHRRAVARDHIVCGQRLPRPEFHALPEGEGEGRAVAAVALAQHILRRKVVRQLEQALVQRLAQHGVDAVRIRDRVERAVFVPRKAEIGVRYIDRILRPLVLLSAGQRTARQQAQSGERRRERTFFPAHTAFPHRHMMPPCTPRWPWVARCDQNSSAQHFVQMPLSMTFSGESPASVSSLTPMPCRST